MNQASADLNRNIGFELEDMDYDTSARTYVRGTQHAAQSPKSNASRYLAKLHSLADCIMDSDDTWVSERPPYEAEPMPARSVKPKIKVRCALPYYYIRRIGLNTDPGAKKRLDHQIVLLNAVT